MVLVGGAAQDKVAFVAEGVRQLEIAEHPAQDVVGFTLLEPRFS